MVGRSLIMTNHDPRMMRQELEQVREWAIEQLAAGTEPPWSWYQYMKLREASEIHPRRDGRGAACGRLTGIGTTPPTRRHGEFATPLTD